MFPCVAVGTPTIPSKFPVMVVKKLNEMSPALRAYGNCPIGPFLPTEYIGA